MMDGANGPGSASWRVTLPQLRPTLFTVHHARPHRLLAGVRPDLHRHAGRSGKTTLTPAYLSYTSAFLDQDWGQRRRHRVHPLRASSWRSPSSSAGCCASGRCRSDASRAVPADGDRTRRREREHPPSHRAAGPRRRCRPACRRHGARRRAAHAGRAIAGMAIGSTRCSSLMALIYIYPFLVQRGDVVQDGCTRRPSDPISLIPQTLSVAAYERLFLHSDFRAVVRELGDRDDLRDARPRVLRARSPATRSPGCTSAGAASSFAGLVAVMAVPPVVLLIPKFLVINQLGLYDTYAGMIIPLLVDAAGVFIMKNFFESIPVSVEEQARIDGAGSFRVFWSVVLPMARPALITIVILSFQGSWNELRHFIVSTQSPSCTTLTKGVASLASGQLSQGTQYPLKLAAAAHHDDPGRRDVLHLPAAHHEHQQKEAVKE